MSSLLNDLGTTLTQDSELAKAFNKHIGEAAKYMAPELAEFLTRHIRDTINSWDEREMAEQVELNIGRDLQKVAPGGSKSQKNCPGGPLGVSRGSDGLSYARLM